MNRNISQFSGLQRRLPKLKWTLFFLVVAIAFSVSFTAKDSPQSWIRINQLGYVPRGIKAAVWATKASAVPGTFQLVNSYTNAVAFTGKPEAAFGAYGPFSNATRLDFTRYQETGSYYLKCGEAVSPVFRIGNDVYSGAADFSLNYLRQQRSGFNPYLKDSCHTGDGYTMYGPMPDTTRINVWGGWHDATDYLQYVTTSATATYHLLSAFRDFPEVFADSHLANGLAGVNGTADVLDEAKWGLDWLVKMHPRPDWMFNQLADDRDHHGFRLPTLDSVDYGVGKGKGRPVYFATGEPQGLGQYRNRTTGMASTAGKFSSAFALGASIFSRIDPALSGVYKSKSQSAYKLGLAKPGVTQTAPNREPYFYEEDNWVDDMELASANLFLLTGDQTYLSQAVQYGAQEKVTPWMGADTARHYQFYPFHNFGHYELSKKADAKTRADLIAYYKEGIERVWVKAKKNAFYRGVPFIWCSNNLNTSFAIQCYLYRKMSGDTHYAALEQACFDWLFGCNPWGKSMVFGLPGSGNTPLHPHSSLSYLYQYPLSGGMMDGPVYGSIYNNLRGLKLYGPDQNADFQSGLVVYHDDAGDYSTNEPTMDGTASLVYLLAEKEAEALKSSAKRSPLKSHGAITRADSTIKKISLVFTGDEFADGGDFISQALEKQHIKASFFLTGNFYRNERFKTLVQRLARDGHYLGSHSDKHLLYCSWENRDSLLVTHQQFSDDLKDAYHELTAASPVKKDAHYFLPPYEWYNDSIAQWTRDMGLQLVNFTPGTRSNADYTYPELGSKYVNSKQILQSILDYEKHSTAGLNGFILLVHIGTDPRRKDKFYHLLPGLISTLKGKGYGFARIDEMLD